jgi:hypothetical protein
MMTIEMYLFSFVKLDCNLRTERKILAPGI